MPLSILRLFLLYCITKRLLFSLHDRLNAMQQAHHLRYIYVTQILKRNNNNDNNKKERDFESGRCSIDGDDRPTDRLWCNVVTTTVCLHKRAWESVTDLCTAQRAVHLLNVKGGETLFFFKCSWTQKLCCCCVMLRSLSICMFFFIIKSIDRLILSKQ